MTLLRALACNQKRFRLAGIADKQVHLGPVIMSNLGIPEVPSLSIESACGSGSVSFREAYANVAA